MSTAHSPTTIINDNITRAFRPGTVTRTSSIPFVCPPPRFVSVRRPGALCFRRHARNNRLRFLFFQFRVITFFSVFILFRNSYFRHSFALLAISFILFSITTFYSDSNGSRITYPGKRRG